MVKKIWWLIMMGFSVGFGGFWGIEGPGFRSAGTRHSTAGCALG